MLGKGAENPRRDLVFESLRGSRRAFNGELHMAAILRKVF
jgi:hypothetical protein